MKHPSKMTVTLSMVWIGAMGLLSNPRWIREARDFVSGMTGHTPTVTPSTAQRGPTAGLR